MSVITLDEALAYLRVAGASTAIDRDLLQGLIDTAETTVARYVGPLSSSAQSVAVVYGGPTFVLPATTVSAVASAVSVAASPTTVTSGFLIGVGGVVTNTSCAEGTWTVTYTAGWVTLPAPVRTAVLELVKHLHRPQAGTRSTGPDASPGYLMPNRVRELLDPYVIPGFA